MAIRKEIENFILLHDKSTPPNIVEVDLAIKGICEKYNEQIANDKTLGNDVSELAKFLSIAQKRNDKTAIFDFRTALMALLRCAADWGLNIPESLLLKFEDLKLVDDLSLADFSRKTLNADIFLDSSDNQVRKQNKPSKSRKRGRPKQYLKDLIKDDINQNVLINILHKYIDDKEIKTIVLIYKAIGDLFFKTPSYLPSAAFEKEFGINQKDLTSSWHNLQIKKYESQIKDYKEKITNDYQKLAKR